MNKLGIQTKMRLLKTYLKRYSYLEKAMEVDPKMQTWLIHFKRVQRIRDDRSEKALEAKMK
jgi:hypothetical protein